MIMIRNVNSTKTESKKKKKYPIVQSTNLAITEQTKTRTSMKNLTNTFSKEKKKNIYITINTPQEFQKQNKIYSILKNCNFTS